MGIIIHDFINNKHEKGAIRPPPGPAKFKLNENENENELWKIRYWDNFIPLFKIR